MAHTIHPRSDSSCWTSPWRERPENRINPGLPSSSRSPSAGTSGRASLLPPRAASLDSRAGETWRPASCHRPAPGVSSAPELASPPSAQALPPERRARQGACLPPWPWPAFASRGWDEASSRASAGPRARPDPVSCCWEERGRHREPPPPSLTSYRTCARDGVPSTWRTGGIFHSCTCPAPCPIRTCPLRSSGRSRSPCGSVCRVRRRPSETCPHH